MTNSPERVRHLHKRNKQNKQDRNVPVEDIRSFDRPNLRWAIFSVYGDLVQQQHSKSDRERDSRRIQRGPDLRSLLVF